MGNILIEMEESSYTEINYLMKQAQDNIVTLKTYTDMFLILENAIRTKQEMKFDAADMLLVDDIPITILTEALQEIQNGTK